MSSIVFRLGWLLLILGISVNLVQCDPFVKQHSYQRGGYQICTVKQQQVASRRAHSIMGKTEENSIYSSLIQSQSQSQQQVEPELGSVYCANLRLPFLGNQGFQIQIIEGSRGSLAVSGSIMSIDSSVSYEFHSNGQASFQLPQDVQQMMRRFRAKLLEGKYCKNSDSIFLKVQTPIRIPISIVLRRHHMSFLAEDDR